MILCETRRLYETVKRYAQTIRLHETVKRIVEGAATPAAARGTHATADLIRARSVSSHCRV